MRNDVYSRLSEDKTTWTHSAMGLSRIHHELLTARIKQEYSDLEVEPVKWKNCELTYKATRPFSNEDFLFKYFFSTTKGTIELVMVSALHSDRNILENILNWIGDFKEVDEFREKMQNPQLRDD